MKGCYNTGNIYGLASTGEGNACYGGIVGDLMYGFIENCYNTGSVEAQNTYCNYDEGTLVGGIAGRIYNNGGSTSIKSSYNTANLVGSSVVVSSIGGIGGIAGFVYFDDSDTYKTTIENCYNTGNMSAANKAAMGGIAGLASSTTISNCYNVGAFSGTSTYEGGILGYNGECADDGYGDNTTTVSYSYYLSTVASYGIGNTSSNSGTTAMSSSDMQASDFVTTLNSQSSGTWASGSTYPTLVW